MRNGYDFDGVFCCNVRELRAEVALEKFGLSLPPSLFHQSGIVKAGLLTAEQYSICIGVVADKPRFAERYEPTPGFPEYVLRLIDEGHEAVVVTMRRLAGALNAKNWACQLGLPEEVEFRSADGAGSKLSYVQDLDSFIDDRAEYLEEMRLAVPHLFLMAEQGSECDFAEVIHGFGEYYEAMHRITDA